LHLLLEEEREAFTCGNPPRTITPIQTPQGPGYKDRARTRSAEDRLGDRFQWEFVFS